MSEEDELDWLHLPAGSEARSLWPCLHDGSLISCESDLLGRAVTLRFEVGYLLGEAEKDVRFVLRFDRVSSVRASLLIRWPGGFDAPDGASKEEHTRLVNEYQAKWREESMSWHEFEAALVTDPLQITDARLAAADGKAAFRAGGFLDENKYRDIYCSIFIRAGGVSATRSDGQPFGVEQFLALGRGYWDSLGNRNKGREGQ